MLLTCCFAAGWSITAVISAISAFYLYRLLGAPRSPTDSPT
jgi:hypothetical protein